MPRIHDAVRFAILAFAVGCGSTPNGASTGGDAGDSGHDTGDGHRDAGSSGKDAGDKGRDSGSGGSDGGDGGRGAADGGRDAGDAEGDSGRDAGDAEGDSGHDSGTVCSATDSTVFALTELDWGEGSSGQWESVGFNLDGLVSTVTSTNLCQPNDGAMVNAIYPDGVGGIDNSFGKNIMPTILGVDPTWVTDINQSLADGAFSALLQVSCLPPTGDAPTLTTKLFDATSLGMMPKLDGTDMWPVAPELLTNPMDPESSSIVFPASSVSGTTFRSGTNQTVVLMIPVTLQGTRTTVTLTLHAAQLTMTLAADRKSATGGVLGGVLNTMEFVSQIEGLGVALGLCGSTVLDALVTQVLQASDILSDGTQDPTQTCDGISIGLSFTMTQAQIGSVGPTAPVTTACP